MLKLRWAAAAMAVIALYSESGEAPKTAPGTVGGTTGDPVVSVSDSDNKMNLAISKARTTVGRFVAALAKPKPNQKSFAIKKLFTSKEGKEHIWLTDVTFNGTEFVGKINNDPDIIKGLKFGDEAKVLKSEISDWMFLEDGAFVGAYTLRALIEIQKDSVPEELRAMKFKD